MNKSSQHTCYCPFINMMPEDALKVAFPEIINKLESVYKNDLYAAFDPNVTIPSPLAGDTKDTSWIKKANTVGINVRTVQRFWNIIPYSFTLPSAQQAIHILPIWEPGVVASLYGPVSWQINPEFYSAELAHYFPHLNTVEHQLKVVVNLLHLTGRVVGMDVVPHTDRYSQIVLANPSLFEWLQRRDKVITDHHADLYQSVETLIWYFLLHYGSAVPDLQLPSSQQAFFYHTAEADRLLMLFGRAEDYEGRLNRRKTLINILFAEGLETTPATMGPPYRGLEVNTALDAAVVDEEGRVWRDYQIKNPKKFSRAFGPLARYKFYHNQNENRDWALDFSNPNIPAWEYFCAGYHTIQDTYNFDFMRGDMSHVQMRPEGVPAQRDIFYDPLGAVKQYVLRNKPWFGYFAESFLAPPDEMAYGDECDHLEASFADSTLGDLQSEPIGTDFFVSQFAQYRYWLENRHFAPNFTLMTADKDDPRFDRFYLKGNELRYFIGLFLTDMPSYMGLGFECRDVHHEPAPNEHYTKLYVFQEKEGAKSTNGPFIWGKNRRLYAQIVRQKRLSEDIGNEIVNADVQWIQPPDPTGQNKLIIWTQKDKERYIFVANIDMENDQSIVPPKGQCIFSSIDEQAPDTEGSHLLVRAGEGLVFAKSTDHE